MGFDSVGHRRRDRGASLSRNFISGAITPRTIAGTEVLLTIRFMTMTPETGIFPVAGDQRSRGWSIEAYPYIAALILPSAALTPVADRAAADDGMLGDC